MSLPEALEPSRDTENKLVAIYIAVLAVLLAINAVGGGNSSKTVMTASIQATDTYAFYQAKNIRQNMLRVAADTLELEAMGTNIPDAARAKMQEKINTYRSTADRYESDTKTNEGKKELLEKAKKLEGDLNIALKQDPYFDYSGGMLQIAIVLASSSLILGGSLLLFSSIGLGILGSALLANAFFLVVELPFIG